MHEAPKAVSIIRKKFEAHVASAKPEIFTPSNEDERNLSEFRRVLDSKRQIGRLTDGEIFFLSTIDALLFDIADFNTKVRKSSASQAPKGENVYDLGKSALQSPEPAVDTVVIPKISNSEADQIIAGLDQQFADKVLKKLKDRVEVDAKPAWEVKDFKVEADVHGEGKNLYDYLAKVRTQLPETPFADEDSQKDLSKMAQPLRK